MQQPQRLCDSCKGRKKSTISPQPWISERGFQVRQGYHALLLRGSPAWFHSMASHCGPAKFKALRKTSKSFGGCTKIRFLWVRFARFNLSFSLNQIYSFQLSPFKEHWLWRGGASQVGELLRAGIDRVLLDAAWAGACPIHFVCSFERMNQWNHERTHAQINQHRDWLSVAWVTHEQANESRNWQCLRAAWVGGLGLIRLIWVSTFVMTLCYRQLNYDEVHQQSNFLIVVHFFLVRHASCCCWSCCCFCCCLWCFCWARGGQKGSRSFSSRSVNTAAAASVYEYYSVWTLNLEFWIDSQFADLAF